MEAAMGQTGQNQNTIKPVYNATCIRVKPTVFIIQMFLSREQKVMSNEKIRLCLTI